MSNIHQSVKARVAMINGNFDLPQATIDGMRAARAAVSACAESLEKIASETGGPVDVGRLIAAMDLLQQTKNVFCDALILPHHV